MNRDPNAFVPFTHENLESKNQLIAFARSKDKTKVEEILAATLIYANLVDYLAQNLLENLHSMCSISTYKSFGAVFYFDPSNKRTSISLGKVINELESYHFPDQVNFLKELSNFSKTRNRTMHELMKLNLSETTNQFDQDLASISKSAESILTMFNTIVTGMTAIWHNAYPAPSTPGK